MILPTVTILAAYLAIILAIGFRSGRGIERNSESFFVANRHLNWLQESMAVFTTAAPAGALLGTTGLFYSAGADMLGYLIGYAFLMLLNPHHEPVTFCLPRPHHGACWKLFFDTRDEAETQSRTVSGNTPYELAERSFALFQETNGAKLLASH